MQLVQGRLQANVVAQQLGVKPGGTTNLAQVGHAASQVNGARFRLTGQHQFGQDRRRRRHRKGWGQLGLHGRRTLDPKGRCQGRRQGQLGQLGPHRSSDPGTTQHPHQLQPAPHRHGSGWQAIARP